MAATRPRRAKAAPSSGRSEPGANTSARFLELVAVLSEEPSVTCGGPDSRPFGHSPLKVRGKVFAMLSPEGTLVLKLPVERVTELVAVGVGTPFGARKGSPMKEWVAFSTKQASLWLSLSREALRFVEALAS